MEPQCGTLRFENMGRWHWLGCATLVIVIKESHCGLGILRQP